MKFLEKSQKLYPLPGVTSLLSQAQRKMSGEATPQTGSNSSNSTSNGANYNNTARQANHSSGGTSSSSSSSFHRSASNASSSTSATSNTNTNTNTKTGTDGRNYTDIQAKLVQQILKAKEGGRGAHYRVLGVESNADENSLKKAYRKLALKLHPDKNSAPQADDAFKALGLAYATLSDTQKRTIYDRYGEEDPDNRGGGGGGMRRPGGGGVHFHGQDVNPEDICKLCMWVYVYDILCAKSKYLSMFILLFYWYQQLM